MVEKLSPTKNSSSKHHSMPIDKKIYGFEFVLNLNHLKGLKYTKNDFFDFYFIIQANSRRFFAKINITTTHLEISEH